METVDEVEIKYKCTVCDLELDSSTVIETDVGEPTCENCSVMCQRCDGIGHINEEYFRVNGSQRWCEPCKDFKAFYCDICNEYYSGSYYSAENTSDTYCESCFENNVYYCEGCDAYYDGGCDANHDDEDDGRLIHDYSYRPDPIFHSSEDEQTRLYFGIEVETEVRGEDYGYRREAAEYAHRLEDFNLAYLKSDGSLECGFEIVSHPMSHSYFMNDAEELWDTITKLKSNYGMMAWGTKTCGLHVHISRNGFNGGSHQHRFLQLVYNNKQFYELLAGRSSSHWAKFDDIYDRDTGQKSFKGKFDRHGSDRYSAVNTNNRNTLEMRIFRGSLNPRFIKSAIDLAHASVEYTRVMSVQEVRNGALSCARLRQYIEDNRAMYPSLYDRIELHLPSINQIERGQNVSISSVVSE